MKTLLALIITLLSSTCFSSTFPVARSITPFSGSRFYVPNDSNKHTSIVMLHGSEGGSERYADMEANVLASQGYAVLVLCYFDCNRVLSLPKQTLKNIEATIVLDAVSWLRNQALSNRKVVVYGYSRGGELSMIVGSLDMNQNNRPDGIIAHSPSDVFVGPYNGGWKEHACWLCIAGNNKCSANSPKTDYEWNSVCGFDNNPKIIDFTKSSWLVSGINVLTGKRIEIEKYDGPILITVGEKDEIWPADQTRRIDKTLKDAGRNPEVHYFAKEGHGFKWDAELIRKEMVLNFLQHVTSQ
ncbi:MAG: dienelactone hydrolase family protein [Bacteriovorax sp.]|nr:dienelactone hydrolase family protein [Bacteriovorax sp.]